MSRRIRDLLVVFVLLLIVFEIAAYVAMTPRPKEQFFQFYALGANRLAEDYYPNGDPDIGLEETMSWHLGVTNSIGNVQLVAIRVKLGNQTMKPPEDLRAQPSPAPLITEFKRFIQDNETWETQFVWRVTSAVEVEGSTRIQGLSLNDEYLLLNASARSGYNFRFIFELWTWRVESGTFEFGWSTGSEQRAAWLQIWFNMTRPMKKGSEPGAYESEYSVEEPPISRNMAAPITRSETRLGVDIHNPNVPHISGITQPFPHPWSPTKNSPRL